jgi:RNA polymerase sigma-70 factor (ECF subfamily)
MPVSVYDSGASWNPEGDLIMSETQMLSDTVSRDTQQLWQEFSDQLRAFIARRVNSAADAEDILQEVFLRVHQHAGGVHHSDRLTSWLFQVTRNAIIDYYRSPIRREQPESVTARGNGESIEAVMPAVEIDLPESPAHEELARCVRPMLEQLPLHYREALELVDLTGLTQTEAAARRGLSVSGMKSRVQRGRQALKDVLVDCCPVQLDTGGRIVEVDQPAATCSLCAGSGEVAMPAEDRDRLRGGCCAGPAPGVGEARTPDVDRRFTGALQA